MLLWLRVTAAVFTGIAGVVSFLRYQKTGKKGQLFLSGVFFLTAAILGFVAYYYSE